MSIINKYTYSDYAQKKKKKEKKIVNMTTQQYYYLDSMNNRQ